MKTVSTLFTFLILLSSCKNFQTVQLDQQEAVNPDLVFGNIPSSNPYRTNTGGIIDDFSSDDHYWEKSGQNLKTLTLHGALILETDSATGDHFVFRKFAPLDFSLVSALVFKVNSMPEVQIPVKVYLVDIYENAVQLTNVFPSDDKLTFPVNYSQLIEVMELEKIVEIRIAPIQAFTGKIFIDEIKVLE